jgi:hypothetical protein
MATFPDPADVEADYMDDLAEQKREQDDDDAGSEDDQDDPAEECFW